MDLGSLIEGPSGELTVSNHSRDFDCPMGVYGQNKRNSQALKAEQVQLSAGGGLINIIYDVAEAPNIEEEVALADTRGLWATEFDRTKVCASIECVWQC